MNNATLKKMQEYKKIIDNARQTVSKARQTEKEAGDKLHTNEITTKEYCEIHLRTEPTQKLYSLVAKAASEAYIETARNALVEDMKANPETWTKYPLHYKKFNDLLIDFFKDAEPEKNGHFCSFSLDTGITGARLTLHNYGYCEHNHSESQILYRDSKDERLTVEEIEKATFLTIIEPCDIAKECKKALKDAEKIKQDYEKTRAKLEEAKHNRPRNYAFYDIFPHIPYLQ